MPRDLIPPPPLRAKRCELCAHCDKENRNCHALYPVAVPFPGPNGQMGIAGVFPAMPPEGWCAKWEPLPIN